MCVAMSSLPVPGLTEQQHGRISRRNLPGLFEHSAKGRTLSDDDARSLTRSRASRRRYRFSACNRSRTRDGRKGATSGCPSTASSIKRARNWSTSSDACCSAFRLALRARTWPTTPDRRRNCSRSEGVHSCSAVEQRIRAPRIPALRGQRHGNNGRRSKPVPQERVTIIRIAQLVESLEPSRFTLFECRSDERYADYF